MSRIAKNPVVIPAKVEVVINADNIAVNGPLGKLAQPLTDAVKLNKDGETITFTAANDGAHARAMAGTLRSLVANMVQGVSEGFTRKLTLVGVGYKAQAQGQMLNLELGYSHPINHKMPEGITVKTPSQTEIEVTGADKQVVGQVAAQIRGYREPEPYKGKGVKYSDEVILRKESKKT